MHTRRESGRDVNRGRESEPPPLPPRAHGPLPTHAQHFTHPRAQPPEGWRGPCPPLCSAAGTAARRARLHGQRGARSAQPGAHIRTRTATGGALLHLRRGRFALRAPPSPPSPPVTQPLALWGLGWALFFLFFPFPRGGSMAGGSPPTATSSTHGQGLQLWRHLFHELAGIFSISSPPRPARAENNSH